MTDRAYEGAELERRVANLLRMGVIGDVDVAAGRARVVFTPEWTSDFLPWFEGRAGGLRTWSAPSAGEQVMVLSVSGEVGAGVILRGVGSNANPAAAADAQTTVLGIWSDGAVERYDDQAHARTLELPAGASFSIKVGGAEVFRLEQDKATVTIGGSQLLLEAGGATLAADALNLGGAGGAKVARVGDTVANGVITGGSAKVKSA